MLFTGTHNSGYYLEHSLDHSSNFQTNLFGLAISLKSKIREGVISFNNGGNIMGILINSRFLQEILLLNSAFPNLIEVPLFNVPLNTSYLLLLNCYPRIRKVALAFCF